MGTFDSLLGIRSAINSVRVDEVGGGSDGCDGDRGMLLL